MIYIAAAPQELVDHLQLVEKRGMGKGQFHIKEKRRLACIKRLSAPITEHFGLSSKFGIKA
jgi:hypothetical protein